MHCHLKDEVLGDRLSTQFKGFKKIAFENDQGSSCAKHSFKQNDDIPNVWKVVDGIVMKGSFCALTGDWYWHQVAACDTSKSLIQKPLCVSPHFMLT